MPASIGAFIVPSNDAMPIIALVVAVARWVGLVEWVVGCFDFAIVHDCCGCFVGLEQLGDVVVVVCGLLSIVRWFVYPYAWVVHTQRCW